MSGQSFVEIVCRNASSLSDRMVILISAKLMMSYERPPSLDKWVVVASLKEGQWFESFCIGLK